MMADYGWTIDTTIFGRPAALVFGLIRALNERKGLSDGPSAADSLALRARREKAAELRKSHRIIPNPKPPVRK